MPGTEQGGPGITRAVKQEQVEQGSTYAPAPPEAPATLPSTWERPKKPKEHKKESRFRKYLRRGVVAGTTVGVLAAGGCYVVPKVFDNPDQHPTTPVPTQTVEPTVEPTKPPEIMTKQEVKQNVEYFMNELTREQFNAWAEKNPIVEYTATKDSVWQFPNVENLNNINPDNTISYTGGLSGIHPVPQLGILEASTSSRDQSKWITGVVANLGVYKDGSSYVITTGFFPNPQLPLLSNGKAVDRYIEQFRVQLSYPHNPIVEKGQTLYYEIPKLAAYPSGEYFVLNPGIDGLNLKSISRHTLIDLLQESVGHPIYMSGNSNDLYNLILNEVLGERSEASALFQSLINRGEINSMSGKVENLPLISIGFLRESTRLLPPKT